MYNPRSKDHNDTQTKNNDS
ncbi:MAG: hypothetical protein PWQ17_2611, partial [Anaerophaga sp.]|nr:hypothetical protein [Anaerophaga sp.]